MLDCRIVVFLYILMEKHSYKKHQGALTIFFASIFVSSLFFVIVFAAFLFNKYIVVFLPIKERFF